MASSRTWMGALSLGTALVVAAACGTDAAAPTSAGSAGSGGDPGAGGQGSGGEQNGGAGGEGGRGTGGALNGGAGGEGGRGTGGEQNGGGGGEGGRGTGGEQNGGAGGQGGVACIPDPVAACAGKGCGPAVDLCGVAVLCADTCVAPQQCGVGGPNDCGVPSCQGGLGAGQDCGSNGDAYCCASPLVPGGVYKRSYDGVAYTDAGFPATLGSYRLDAYEVTVGRFRAFVDAVVGGWLPAAGAGKHAHLGAGSGLNAGTEPGWNSAWNASLPAQKATWDGAAGLACDPTYATWTPDVGANEQRPVNCVDWFQSHAFCIWDGGFLPSEAEWDHAGAGGTDQRAYPWSFPFTSTTIDSTYAVYNCHEGGAGCTGVPDILGVGAKSPKGDGKWGHADMAGGMWEWVLDWHAPYANPCVDCANLTPSVGRGIRGGGFYNDAAYQRSAFRGNFSTESVRNIGIGVRCGRQP